MAALALLLAACGGGSSASSTKQQPSTSAPATTADPVTHVKEAIIAADNAFWLALIDAGKTNDSNSPALERYATGQELVYVRTRLLANKHFGIAGSGGVIDRHPVVTSVSQDGHTATVENCYFDHTVHIHIADGTPAEAPDKTTRFAIDTLTLVADQWKVSDSKEVTEKAGCTPST